MRSLSSHNLNKNNKKDNRDMIFEELFPLIPHCFASGNEKQIKKILLFRKSKELGNSFCLSSTYNLRHSKHIFIDVKIV